MSTEQPDGETASDDAMEHLRDAAREMIGAARAMLDAAEDLLERPESVAALVGMLGEAAKTAGASLFTGEAASDGGATAPRADDDSVERIEVR